MLFQEENGLISWFIRVSQHEPPRLISWRVSSLGVNRFNLLRQPRDFAARGVAVKHSLCNAPHDFRLRLPERFRCRCSVSGFNRTFDTSDKSAYAGDSRPIDLRSLQSLLRPFARLSRVGHICTRIFPAVWRGACSAFTKQCQFNLAGNGKNNPEKTSVLFSDRGSVVSVYQ